MRIDHRNDLSVQYGGEGTTPGDTYFVHKVIVGQRCYNRIEADFTFDSRRQLSDKQVTGGTYVDKSAYDSYKQEQAAAGSTS